MSRFPFDLDKLQGPPKEVADVVSRLAYNDGDDSERRAEKRYRATFAVPVVEVNEDLVPCGEPRIMLTTHISCHGIGLVTSQPVTAKRLIVQLPLPGEPQVIVNVTWSKQVRRYWILGGEIAARIDSAANLRPTF